MHRSYFLALAALSPWLLRVARAQDDVDPAMTSQGQALRVLLGSGEAIPSPDGAGFTFDGRAYRGSFVRTDDGRVVNLVGLDAYLYSVVSREMPSSWATAALAAQAICARTYVLARSDPRRAFDLVPSELNQVYEGIAGESPAGTQAVNATASQVLTFGTRYALVAYSSCCGGHTEASSDAWGGSPIPYLCGIVCTWCTQSPNYRWSASVPMDAVANRFSEPLAPFGRLTAVRIAATDPSGRAATIELVAERGSVSVKGSAFRIAVGARLLRSLLITRLTLAPGAASIDVDGGGLGHGVGLCQWGAQGMALAGRTAADILGFYFPGARLAKLGNL